MTATLLPLRTSQTTSARDRVWSLSEYLPRAYGTSSFAFLGDVNCGGYLLISIGHTSTGGTSCFFSGVDQKLDGALSTSRALAELRLKTGFTWDQLSRLFRVDRRSLHFWASGKPLSATHEEQLYSLHALICCIDRGSVRANRAILLSQLSGSEYTPYDLLLAGKYEEVRSLVGSSAAVRKHPTSPSPEQIKAKLPSPPFAIDEDIDDSPLPTSGIYRVSKRVRVGRAKPA
jgi:hypothetical protein